jgi:hypothetical protein
VTNTKQAVSIAYSAATTLYGRHILDGEKPLSAVRVANGWEVTGSLRRGWNGGVVDVVISSRDGTVTSICHGK